MRGGILAALLVFSTMAHAADAGAPAAKGSTERKSSAKKGGAKTTAPGKPNKELQLTKRALLAAVGACARPEICDPTSRNADKDAIELLKDTEEKFMVACQACASQEQCEREAQRMRDGKQSRGNTPCP